MNIRKPGLLRLWRAGTILGSAHAASHAALNGPMGPLRACAANPRYFADPSGRPVYLTGSQTWLSLQDGVLSNYTAVSQPFDYPGYLGLLQTNHHNFIRLWRWELTTHEPQPWPLTGPGPRRETEVRSAAVQPGQLRPTACAGDRGPRRWHLREHHANGVHYEICNEGLRHTREWQYAMVRFIKDAESKMPKRHPVGMTSVGDMNEHCLKSPADWTSLGTTGWDQPKDPWTSDPPAADGHMVCLLDTDHIGWKVFIEDAAFTRAWVWKSFTRGHDTLLMENLADAAGWIAGRAAMGHTRRLADRVDLATLVPHPELASTRYCLADPGQSYVVYVPEGGEVTVNVSGAPGSFTVEWIHAANGSSRLADPVAGGSQRSLKAPFAGDAVLYLRQRQEKDPAR